MDVAKAPAKSSPAKSAKKATPKPPANRTPANKAKSPAQGRKIQDKSRISGQARRPQQAGPVPQFNNAFQAKPPAAPAQPAAAPAAPAAPPAASAPATPAAGTPLPETRPEAPPASAPTAPIVPSRIANAPPVKNAAPGTAKTAGGAGGILGLDTVANGVKNIRDGNVLQGSGQILSGTFSTIAGVGSTIADKLGGAAKHLLGLGHIAAGVDGVNDLINKSGALDKTIGAAKLGSAAPLLLSKAFAPLAPGLTGVATALDGGRDLYNQISTKGLSGLAESKGVGGILKPWVGRL